MRVHIPSHAPTARLGVATTNRVLRNTYLLLAISMVPTVAGAFLGAIYPLMAVLGWASIVVFLAGMFGFQALIIRNRYQSAGVFWMLAFTFFMGYFIGPTIGFALGNFSNGAQLVGLAAGGTAAIFFGIAGYASVTERDFSSPSLGKSLFIGMWMLFVLSLLNIFFQSSAVVLAVSSLDDCGRRRVYPVHGEPGWCAGARTIILWRRLSSISCCSTSFRVCLTC